MTKSRGSNSGSVTEGAGDSPSAPVRSLRIVITSPFAWPWVRRGSERFLHDLSRYLIGRGHRITVYSTGPEDAIEDREGIPYHLLKQRFGTGLRQLNCCHYFAFRLQHFLLHQEPDLVFCMNYFDAYAAIRARQRSGASYKVVFHSAGILSLRTFRAVPLDAWLFRTVRRWADVTVVVSQFARDVYRRDFAKDAVVLYPPVVIKQFAPADGDDPRGSLSGPRILFVGDADERRKGARALCKAFPRVQALHPGAQLLFAGHASAPTQRALLAEAARLGIASHTSFLGVGRLEDLPSLYRTAAVTVLPAVGESFGMALAESLAAGTPIVGARHGGITEIIDDDLVGQLFDPGKFADQTDNVDGLADAILQVLERGKSAEVIAACRAKANSYGWAMLGPAYESVLLQLVATAATDAKIPES